MYERSKARFERTVEMEIEYTVRAKCLLMCVHKARFYKSRLDLLGLKKWQEHFPYHYCELLWLLSTFEKALNKRDTGPGSLCPCVIFHCI